MLAKRGKWIILVMMIGVLGLGCAEWEQFSQRVENPNPNDKLSIDRGRALFAAKGCESCHGKVGKGDGPQATTTKLPPTNFTDRGWMITRSDPDLYWAIVRGREKAGMRPFGNELSANETWDLVSFVRSLY
ncbi:MAG: cytochrome c [Chloroflexi bacterium]|nr:cytochrome c [Chloroflexota bacterium]